MKQYKIDNGEIGGAIQVFGASTVIFTPLTFIGIAALNYDRFLRDLIDLKTFIVVAIVFVIIYEWAFFAFIFPSMMRFGNRQSTTHDSPIYKEVLGIVMSLNELIFSLKRDVDYVDIIMHSQYSNYITIEELNE